MTQPTFQTIHDVTGRTVDPSGKLTASPGDSLWKHLWLPRALVRGMFTTEFLCTLILFAMAAGFLTGAFILAWNKRDYGAFMGGGSMVVGLAGLAHWNYNGGRVTLKEKEMDRGG